MNSIEKALIELADGLLELWNVTRGMNGKHEIMHGIFQGSHEAALFEAQGGTLGPGTINHLNQVENNVIAIQKGYSSVNQAIGKLQGVDPAVASRTRVICNPILQLAQQYIQTGRTTIDAANSLKQTDPTRFQGLNLGLGGMGPEVGRTPAALVSNQLNKQAADLAARGYDSRLIPPARSHLQSVLVAIRQLPIDGRETAAKMSAALASMRLLLTQTVTRASIVGQARIAAAFLSIEGFLTSIGSRLTAPIIIPHNVYQNIRQILGIPSLEEA